MCLPPIILYAFIEVEQYMLRAGVMSAAVRNPLKQELQISLARVRGVSGNGLITYQALWVLEDLPAQSLLHAIIRMPQYSP
jgi:hypothetical protein